MPVYEFRCSKCGEAFDLTRPMSKAGNAAKCPKDGTKAIRVYGAAIHVGGDFDFDFPDGDMGGMDGMPDMGGMGGMPDMGGMGGMPDMGDMGGFGA